MAHDFWVSIRGARGEEWLQIAGTRNIPVKSPIPVLAALPGDRNARVYLVELAALEPDVRERITSHLADKFGLSPKEAADELQTSGIPILEDDCIVTIRNPVRWIG